MARYDEAYWQHLTTGLEPVPLMGTLKRMVENQEQKVTVSLVDNLAEHEVLESLLEDSKPALAPALGRLDYLLRTPWRYPPLPWGSRFGRRFEPSLFYGSLSDEALFAEAAYYRLVFLDGMQTPFRERVISQHTIFEARYRTAAGADLTQPPFVEHEATLAHKSRYGASQALGTVLRERGVAALIYRSARSAERRRNIALISPTALRSRRHQNPVRGLCETTLEGVRFRFARELRFLPRRLFLVRGELPLPAS